MFISLFNSLMFASAAGTAVSSSPSSSSTSTAAAAVAATASPSPSSKFVRPSHLVPLGILVAWRHPTRLTRLYPVSLMDHTRMPLANGRRCSSSMCRLTFDSTVHIQVRSRCCHHHHHHHLHHQHRCPCRPQKNIYIKKKKKTNITKRMPRQHNG
jgi:hypothetical protein